ncbi:MAG: cytochrome b [Pseudomonadota bacterium]|jgi:cytochrome b561
MLRNTFQGYGLVARALHWSAAALLVGVLVLGLVVEEMAKGPARTAAMNWHQSLGFVLLVLMAVRLIWRLIDPPPAPEGGPLARRLAPLLHWALYGLAIAQPLSGWLLTQAEGHELALFGSIPVPVLLAASEPLEEILEGVHGTLWILLLIAVLGHVGAALKHHFFDRDRTLVRMLRG